MLVHCVRLAREIKTFFFYENLSSPLNSNLIAFFIMPYRDKFKITQNAITLSISIAFIIKPQFFSHWKVGSAGLYIRV